MFKSFPKMHCAFHDLIVYQDNLSLVVRKPVSSVSDQVRHKLGCTATEDD